MAKAKTKEVLHKFGELSDAEIMRRAEQIAAKNKPPIEKMPINSPEQARSYLEALGYESLPPAKPN